MKHLRNSTYHKPFDQNIRDVERLILRVSSVTKAIMQCESTFNFDSSNEEVELIVYDMYKIEFFILQALLEYIASLVPYSE